MLKVLHETPSFSVASVSPSRLNSSLLDTWERLFEAQATPANPFLAPTWVLRWYSSFVAPQDQVVLVVSRADEQVVGILPMYVSRRRLGPLRLACRLLPVGAGIGSNPYEIPGLLADPRILRDVTRALTTACLNRDVDWSELPLAPEQSWFEWDWLKVSSEHMSFGEPVRARACVILPLRPTWDETRTTLKRNVKESIRRSANRLKKDGRPFEVVRQSSGLDQAVVERFLSLHQARSELGQNTNQQHPDAYAAKEHRQLMLDALPQLGREGRATMFELYLDGTHVASQLGLHAPGTSYVHSSGFHPDTWELGVVTHLQAELIRYAIERGDSVVNFSPGPNVSKLRWSERLWVTNEFAFGAGPRSLMVKFTAFNAFATWRTLVQAADRHRVSTRPGQRAT